MDKCFYQCSLDCYFKKQKDPRQSICVIFNKYFANCKFNYCTVTHLFNYCTVTIVL